MWVGAQDTSLTSSANAGSIAVTTSTASPSGGFNGKWSIQATNIPGRYIHCNTPALLWAKGTSGDVLQWSIEF